MNRVSTLIVIALFAVAALEFGLLGAGAAGVTRAGDRDLPPVVGRGAIVDTPTNTPTATPASPDGPSPSDVTGIFMQADPLTIRCDGGDRSHVEVKLYQPNGDPVVDYTPVHFRAINGDTSPHHAVTSDGAASTDVWFYSDSPANTLFVESGLLRAQLRILCRPDSDGGCPVSPPSVSPGCPTPTPPPCVLSPPSVSPPCNTPTPTPFPCNPSPGSGPLSPPCPTEEPDCPLSPPAVSPPCATPTPPDCPLSPPAVSPPCVTPTPPDCPLSPPAVSPPCATETRAPSVLAMALDCDPSSSGIQDECDITTAAGSHDIAVYLINHGDAPVQVAAFNGKVRNPDTSRLTPRPGGYQGINENPDFDAVPEPNTWECLPNLPDTGEDGPGTSVSLMSCFDAQQQPPLVVQAEEERRLFLVHYTVPPAADPGDIPLGLFWADVFDPLALGLGTCDYPYSAPLMVCRGATLHLVAPSPTATGTPPPAATPTRPARTATTPPRTATVEPSRTPRPRGRCADVNGDGRVTMRDVRLVTEAVARRVYDERYDINGNGKLGHADILRAIRQLGRRC